MTPEQRERRNAARRVNRPYLKPGPKPRAELVPGRDYLCGECADRKRMPCPYCLDGCPECFGVGEVACEVCQGGACPPPPPDWLSPG